MEAIQVQEQRQTPRQSVADMAYAMLCDTMGPQYNVVLPISAAVREEMELSYALFCDALAELERMESERRAEDQLALELANLCM